MDGHHGKPHIRLLFSNPSSLSTADHVRSWLTGYGTRAICAAGAFCVAPPVPSVPAQAASAFYPPDGSSWQPAAYGTALHHQEKALSVIGCPRILLQLDLLHHSLRLLIHHHLVCGQEARLALADLYPVGAAGVRNRRNCRSGQAMAGFRINARWPMRRVVMVLMELFT